MLPLIGSVPFDKLRVSGCSWSLMVRGCDLPLVANWNNLPLMANGDKLPLMVSQSNHVPAIDAETL